MLVWQPHNKLSSHPISINLACNSFNLNPQKSHKALTISENMLSNVTKTRTILTQKKMGIQLAQGRPKNDKK